MSNKRKFNPMLCFILNRHIGVGRMSELHHSALSCRLFIGIHNPLCFYQYCVSHHLHVTFLNFDKVSWSPVLQRVRREIPHRTGHACETVGTYKFTQDPGRSMSCGYRRKSAKRPKKIWYCTAPRMHGRADCFLCRFLNTAPDDNGIWGFRER